jgi:hypothetical protein
MAEAPHGPKWIYTLGPDRTLAHAVSSPGAMPRRTVWGPSAWHRQAHADPIGPLGTIAHKVRGGGRTRRGRAHARDAHGVLVVLACAEVGVQRDEGAAERLGRATWRAPRRSQVAPHVVLRKLRGLRAAVAVKDRQQARVLDAACRRARDQRASWLVSYH